MYVYVCVCVRVCVRVYHVCVCALIAQYSILQAILTQAQFS